MKKITVIFGTRPEAVKMCPLVNELKRRKDAQVFVCVTGQHREMLDSVLSSFGVTPDADLKIMKPSQTLFDVTERTLDGMREVLENGRTDIALVHGDTSTAFAAALACYYEKIPVGHVEAGLRTHDVYSPYPEEFNRTAIDALSSYLFAPTERAKNNLLGEGKPEKDIYVVGNTVLDALKTTVKADYDSEILRAAAGKRIIVVTAHRRESQGGKMNEMLSAIARAARENDAFFVFPMHKSPSVREAAKAAFSGCPNVLLTEPLDVIDFHNLCARAYLCVTDSGGIQEEAPSLSLPVLVMRNVTERPEALECGAARLCGTDGEKIYSEINGILQNPARHDAMTGMKNPYGDGRSCEKIADILLGTKSE